MVTLVRFEATATATVSDDTAFFEAVVDGTVSEDAMAFTAFVCAVSDEGESIVPIVAAVVNAVGVMLEVTPAAASSVIVFVAGADPEATDCVRYTSTYRY